MPVIPVLRRMRQEDYEFKASMDYNKRPCLKKLRAGIYLSGRVLA
jgi:hypothetical protein